MSAITNQPARPATSTQIVGEEIVLDATKQQRGKMAIFPGDHVSMAYENHNVSVPAWEPLGAGSINPIGGSASGVGIGGSVPLTSLATEVGQMKLDAPPRHAGQQQPGVRI